MTLTPCVQVRVHTAVRPVGFYALNCQLVEQIATINSSKVCFQPYLTKSSAGMLLAPNRDLNSFLLIP